MIMSYSKIIKNLISHIEKLEDRVKKIEYEVEPKTVDEHFGQKRNVHTNHSVSSQQKKCRGCGHSHSSHKIYGYCDHYIPSNNVDGRVWCSCSQFFP